MKSPTEDTHLTPKDWERLCLPFMRTPLPSAPVQSRQALSGQCPTQQASRIPLHWLLLHDPQQQFLWAVAQGQGSRVWQLTYFSLSPNHLDIKSEEDTEKKVELLASVATALAR